MFVRGLAIPTLLFASLVSVAATVEAAPFPMSGSHRHFCCTNPGLIGGAPLRPPMGYIFGSGTVSVMGAAPQTIVVPPSLIGSVTTFILNPHPNPKFKSVSLHFDVTNGPGSLAKNKGAGTFSFCPRSVGPGKGACTAPNYASPSPRNGRFYFKAGPNKFGGTMQMLGGVFGKNTAYPYTGAPSSTINYFYAPFSPIGGPSVPNYSIFSGKSFTVTAGGAKNGPRYLVQSVVGFPWTTGYMLLSISKNANPPTQTVAISGYDKRTLPTSKCLGYSGCGNIQFVSGQLFNSFAAVNPGTNPRGAVLTMTLPEPGTSLGMASGLLMLTLLGLIRARRRR